MVEQRPFKALVVGSSPTQPRVFLFSREVGQAAVEAIRQAVEHNPVGNFIPLAVAICCSFSGSLWPI